MVSLRLTVFDLVVWWKIIEENVPGFNNSFINLSFSKFSFDKRIFECFVSCLYFPSWFNSFKRDSFWFNLRISISLAFNPNLVRSIMSCGRVLLIMLHRILFLILSIWVSSRPNFSHNEYSPPIFYLNLIGFWNVVTTILFYSFPILPFEYIDFIIIVKKRWGTESVMVIIAFS